MDHVLYTIDDIIYRVNKLFIKYRNREKFMYPWNLVIYTDVCDDASSGAERGISKL